MLQRINRGNQMYSKGKDNVASREACAKRAARKCLRACSLTLAIAILLAAMVKFQPRAAMITKRVVTPVTESMSLPQSLRRIYPYSVIAGGAYNAVELRTAAQKDSVVHEHYRDFDLDRTRLVVLRRNRQQYVSYRIAGQIYWTKKRLLIPKGELLLTDGTHYARTRCGNRLSDTPRNVTSSFGPDPPTVDLGGGGSEVPYPLPPQPAHTAVPGNQGPQTPPNTHEFNGFVPGDDAWVWISPPIDPRSPFGYISSPYPWGYVNTPALAPVIQAGSNPPRTTPVGISLPPPADPAMVPEPGTLYLFGLSAITSLCALIWLGRHRRQ